MAAPPPPMPKEVEITPDAVTFACGNAGKSTYFDIKIVNKGTKRAAFKVRCTSANVFRVQPPTGFVKGGGESLVVRLWFQNRRFIESTKHYFAVHIIFNDDAKMPNDVFPKTAKPDGVKRLSVAFTKEAPAASAGPEPAAPASLMAAPSIMPSAMGAPAASAIGAPPAPPAAAGAPAVPANRCYLQHTGKNPGRRQEATNALLGQ